MGDVSRILKTYGALNTGRALEKILDVAFDTEKHSEDLKAPAPVTPITTDSSACHSLPAWCAVSHPRLQHSRCGQTSKLFPGWISSV